MSGAGADDLAKLRAEYLAFLDVQQQAFLEFRDALDVAADVFRVIRTQVEQDHDILGLGGFIDPKPLRATLASAEAEFERTRRIGQHMLFRLLRAEGATAEVIARAWGLTVEAVEAVLEDPGEG